MDIRAIKKKLIQLGRKKVRFIILFGSVAHKKNTPLSDIDIAVYYDGSAEERFRFRMRASGELSKVDLHIFQDLPLAVQKEVLSGKQLYFDDYQFMFDQYMNVIKEFSTFEKYYDEYLTEMRKVSHEST